MGATRRHLFGRLTDPRIRRVDQLSRHMTGYAIVADGNDVTVAVVVEIPCTSKPAQVGLPRAAAADMDLGAESTATVAQPANQAAIQVDGDKVGNKN